MFRSLTHCENSSIKFQDRHNLANVSSVDHVQLSFIFMTLSHQCKFVDRKLLIKFNTSGFLNHGKNKLF